MSTARSMKRGEWSYIKFEGGGVGGSTSFHTEEGRVGAHDFTMFWGLGVFKSRAEYLLKLYDPVLLTKVGPSHPPPEYFFALISSRSRKPHAYPD